MIKRFLIDFAQLYRDLQSDDRDTSRRIDHTLQYLLLRTPCLEEIEHFGVYLPQEHFGLLVNIPGLTTFKLRKTHGYNEGLCERTDLHPDLPSWHLEHELDRLSRLSRLTVLEVCQLRYTEAPLLAKAVRSLTRLQHLRISEIYNIYDDPYSSTGPYSPLTCLMAQLYLRSSITTSDGIASDTSSDLSDSDDVDHMGIIQPIEQGFSASLKSLEHVDNTE